MRRITINYHHDPEGWWFESPDIPGWVGGDASLARARQLAEEGARFALETALVECVHILSADVSMPMASDYEASSESPARLRDARLTAVTVERGTLIPA